MVSSALVHDTIQDAIIRNWANITRPCFEPDYKASHGLYAQAGAMRRVHRPARSSSSTTTAGAASRS